MSDDSNGNPPVIEGEFGPTTEWCRKQAAMNIRNEPEKKALAIKMLGEARARELYPEGFSNEV